MDNLTRAQRTAGRLLSEPGRWISATEFAQPNVGGFCAWRSYISDVRRAPFNLRVKNKLVREKLPTGEIITRSYYMVED